MGQSEIALTEPLVRVNYPEGLTFWQKDIRPQDRLEFINPEDFPKEQVLKGLGIKESSLKNSFGICDAGEIKSRLEIMRFLLENTDFRHWLDNFRKSDLPRQEQQFLDYFDPVRKHDPYWQMIRDFLALIRKKDEIPERLRIFTETIETSLVLEETERSLGKVVADRLQNVTAIEGIMEFVINMELGNLYEVEHEGKDERWVVGRLSRLEEHVHGHRMFSFALTSARHISFPKWLENRFDPRNLLGIGAITRGWINSRNNNARKKALHDMVIRKATDGLLEDITNGLRARLNRFKWGKDDAKDLEEAKVRIYFSYSDKGLQIRIVSLTPDIKVEKVSFRWNSYEGYNKRTRKIIDEAEREYIQILQKHREDGARATFSADLRKRSSKLFNPFTVDSRKTDSEHRWYAITNLYRTSLNEATKILDEHRSFFNKHIGELEDVLKLGKTLAFRARQLRTHLCWPGIVTDGGSVVSFDEILPLHLLGRDNKPKVIPIRGLPTLNGQLLVLTGHHGGGKTVTSLVIAELIFAVQSGLPVFGRGVRLNPKKTIGLVFNTEGEGSTAELLVRKMVKVMKAVNRSSGKNIVLILDELGTGTQEVSGFELGRDLLTDLAEKGVSVVFNTQITSLAEYAQDNLKALCFQLDRRHRIQPGIGDGGMNTLRKTTGLDRLFKQRKSIP